MNPEFFAFKEMCNAATDPQFKKIFRTKLIRWIINVAANLFLYVLIFFFEFGYRWLIVVIPYSFAVIYYGIYLKDMWKANKEFKETGKITIEE